MTEEVYQGDILKIVGVKYPIIVASKEAYNKTGMIIGCPFVNEGFDAALHVEISVDGKEGYVYCENLKTYDISYRGYRRIGQLSTVDTMEVADSVMGIFDYIYP